VCRGSGQRPSTGEADLGDGDAQALGDAFGNRPALAVGGDGVGLETRMLPAAIIRLDGRGAGQEPTAERTVSHEADPKLSGSRQNVGLHLADPKRIFALQGGDGVV
jgi:hypothetical protein